MQSMNSQIIGVYAILKIQINGVYAVCEDPG